MDAATKKLILNLLGSIRSVVPVVSPPGPGTPEMDPDIRSQDKIRNVLVHGRQHSAELDGLIDLDELLRYTMYISDYQDIIEYIKIILQDMKNCRDSAWTFASKLADMVEDHIQMTYPSDQPEKEGHGESIPITFKSIKLKIV